MDLKGIDKLTKKLQQMEKNTRSLNGKKIKISKEGNYKNNLEEAINKEIFKDCN